MDEIAHVRSSPPRLPFRMLGFYFVSVQDLNGLAQQDNLAAIRSSNFQANKLTEANSRSTLITTAHCRGTSSSLNSLAVCSKANKPLRPKPGLDGREERRFSFALKRGAGVQGELRPMKIIQINVIVKSILYKISTNWLCIVRGNEWKYIKGHSLQSHVLSPSLPPFFSSESIYCDTKMLRRRVYT